MLVSILPLQKTNFLRSVLAGESARIENTDVPLLLVAHFTQMRPRLPYPQLLVISDC